MLIETRQQIGPKISTCQHIDVCAQPPPTETRRGNKVGRCNRDGGSCILGVAGRGRKKWGCDSERPRDMEP